MIQEIKINCDTKLYIEHENLLPFQGELKTLSETNYLKLKNQIIEQGFSAPVFVWKNDGKFYLLDGHQRATTVTRMKAEGYKIPPLPAVEVFAKTKLEAKKKLLSYVSQFGKVDGKGLYQYILEAELGIEDMSEYEIPELDMAAFKEEFFDGIAASEAELPDLSGANDGTYINITFKLLEDQKADVDEAIKKAIKENGLEDMENKTGEALALILNEYLK